MLTIGEKIREARLKAGLSQAQLAKLIGTKQGNIARYEANGQSPTINKLLEIAEATNIAPHWFLEDIKPSTK